MTWALWATGYVAIMGVAVAWFLIAVPLTESAKHMRGGK